MQQLCTQTINLEWSSLKIKLLLEFLQYLKKQAERGVNSGFWQTRAMVTLGWLPSMAHRWTGLALKLVCLNNLSHPPAPKSKGSLETHLLWRPYYPSIELHTFTSVLYLSTPVACTASNQQYLPPPFSCGLPGGVQLKPALAQWSLQEIGGCPSIQLHSKSPQRKPATQCMISQVRFPAAVCAPASPEPGKEMFRPLFGMVISIRNWEMSLVIQPCKVSLLRMIFITTEAVCHWNLSSDCHPTASLSFLGPSLAKCAMNFWIAFKSELCTLELIAPIPLASTSEQAGKNSGSHSLSWSFSIILQGLS